MRAKWSINLKAKPIRRQAQGYELTQNFFSVPNPSLRQTFSCWRAAFSLVHPFAVG